MQPHIDLPKKTPIALKDVIKKVLNTIKANGIIQRVTEQTTYQAKHTQIKMEV